MTDFNKRGGVGSYGARGGKPSFGGGRDRKPFGKSGFAKKPWGDKPRGDAPFTLHKATCAECSKTCEVPFRPMSGKPVYCKDCFNPAGGSFKEGGRGGDRFPKKDFKPRGEYTPRSENSSGNNEAVMKQFEVLNTKIEALTRAVEALASNKAEIVTEEESAPESLKKVIKRAVKKIAKKK